MSQAPIMPVATDAMIADTTHLSAEEFGAYHLILYATWRNNGQPLPDDDKRLARVVRMTPAKWSKVRPVLAEFFDISDGAWRQKRLEKEWSGVQARVAKNRDNGSKGGRPKSLEENKTENPVGSSEKTETITQPKASHNHIQTDANASDARAGFAEWYAAYPHKVGKAAAEKAYVAARRKVDQRTLLDAVSRYIRDKPPDRSYCNPATWLNQERWLDQPAPQSAGPPKPAPYRPPANLVTAEDLQRH